VRGAGALVAGEHPQFGVDSQNLGGDLLAASACLNAWANQVDPVGGNGFDPFFAAGHEGEGPQRMAVPFGAMAGRLSAATVRKGQ